jgi:hypothetical protein
MYVRSAKYTFGQLAAWTRAFTHAVRSQKLTYVDIDERLNRISIGASDLSTATELQRLGESLAIPVDAFSTEIRGATASDATLQQTYRPIYGSLKIVIYGPGNVARLGTLHLSLTVTTEPALIRVKRT